jgi:CDP-glucose 4,6-dehydratase
VQRLCDKWGGSACYEYDATAHPHEAHCLKLDCSKAKAALGWWPRWSLERAIDSIITWVMDYKDGQDVRDVSLKQLEQYVC